MISIERRRQIKECGYGSLYGKSETAIGLLDAGLCYGINISCSIDPEMDIEEGVPDAWPWDDKYWEPTLDDPIKQLVKAGALIASQSSPTLVPYTWLSRLILRMTTCELMLF